MTTTDTLPAALEQFSICALLAAAIAGGWLIIRARRPLVAADPVRTFRRARMLALIDGFSVASLATLSLLISLLLLDASSLLVSGGLLFGAVTELRGALALSDGHARGVKLLRQGQGLILGTVLAFCVWSWLTLDVAAQFAALAPSTREALTQLGLTAADFVPLLDAGSRVTYALMALLSIAIQGGLLSYYFRVGPTLLRYAALTPPRAAP